jgi:hypothetical protein
MTTTSDNKKYLDYLNDLRDSGVTNMFGARPYLMQEFGIDAKKAQEVLLEWMSSYRGKP